MLKTDYKNDVLDTSKNTERVYNLKNASGEIVEENIRIEDITEYSQEGTKFGANDINATNTEVNRLTTSTNTLTSSVNAINNNLKASDNTVFKFGKDGDGNYGYYKGDGTFAPFKKALQRAMFVGRTSESTAATTGQYFATDLSYISNVPYNATYQYMNGFKFTKACKIKVKAVASNGSHLCVCHGIPSSRHPATASSIVLLPYSASSPSVFEQEINFTANDYLLVETYGNTNCGLYIEAIES